jgi:hypothetical protein
MRRHFGFRYRRCSLGPRRNVCFRPGLGFGVRLDACCRPGLGFRLDGRFGQGLLGHGLFGGVFRPGPPLPA